MTTYTPFDPTRDDRWDDDWDEGWGEAHPTSDRDLPDRLVRIVFIDGVLVDVERAPVRGSGYECAAMELEAQRRPRVPEPVEPIPPAWERELSSLDLRVGGRTALLALTDAPLEPRSLPAECVEVVGRLDALELGAEFTTAVRNALVLVFDVCPDLLCGAPEQVAAALTWIVARANGMTGAGKRLRQADIKAVFGLKGFPSDLAVRMTGELQRYQPDRHSRPWGYSTRHELCSGDVLVSSVRERIIAQRDRALAAAERARQDDEARAATP